MRASYKWLMELCPLEVTPAELGARLTAAGLEVEGSRRYGDLPGVVVAELRAKRPHPTREKLTVVSLFDGARELEVVCGAANVPAPGKRVLFARPGARLPSGLAIAERTLGEITSHGMICSESELDIGADSAGIVVLADELAAAPGTPVADALALEDVVFDIGLTPNRPDCLGHLGLARELSALFGARLRLPAPELPRALRQAPASPPAGARPVVLFAALADAGAPATAQVALSVADAQRCPRYATALVEGVAIGVSPFWLRYRLHVLGLRPINNVVDITNFVLLEYGYPTHAFDLELVRGGRIEVRPARDGERMTTLDGVERQLGPDDLLICDGERPLAIAGVMGGLESGVSERTRRVLVECAYFDPRSVRRTARRLGLHTDASHRFERGVDARAVPGVLARVVSLICSLAGGASAPQGYEVYPDPFVPREIQLRFARLEGLLGVAIAEEQAQRILEALGCEVKARASGALRVRAPTWRPDLAREEDLIEEVARVWGYDKIPTEAPSVRAALGATQPLTRLVRRLKERAAALGLTEAVNLAFTSPKLLRAARAPEPAVRVENPLSEERSVMRTSLLPGLLQNVQRAQRHQVANVALFELARVFRASSEPLPEERHQLALILAGAQASWLGAAAPYDFYHGKGLLEALLTPLACAPLAFASDDALSAEFPCLHPRRAARFSVAQKPLGALGELHPELAEELELTGPVVYAELSVADLLALARVGAAQLRPVPRFPSSTRDLAIVVDEASEAGEVAAALREAGGALVEAVELFDLYRGGQLEAGKKSLAFRIIYRDPEATLTDPRVDEVHERVIEETRRRFAASLRA